MLQLLLSSVALLLGFASAIPIPTNVTRLHLSKRAGGVTSNVWEAAWQTYDYVVIGGGLTGLTVAARLAEDPTTSILVIEAGGDNRWDSRVYDIYTYGQAFGSELDWQLPTDQGRKMIAYVSTLLPLLVLMMFYNCSGKTLGGSTSINGAAWTRGIAAQYDAWSTLLEPSEAYLDWNWSSLFQYMKKVRS
jgi:choline dehydrogenase